MSIENKKKKEKNGDMDEIVKRFLQMYWTDFRSPSEEIYILLYQLYNAPVSLHRLLELQLWLQSSDYLWVSEHLNIHTSSHISFWYTNYLISFIGKRKKKSYWDPWQSHLPIINSIAILSTDHDYYKREHSANIGHCIQNQTKKSKHTN